MPIREDTPQSITDGMVDQQEDSEIILPLDQKIYFYQMYRPGYTGTEKRIDPIISSNNHINVFTIDPDEAYEFDGNIAEMEVASKLVISNTEEQEQKPIIRRKIVISERCEFLQNGNGAVALFEPIETEADLDRLWFFDSVSPKYGYAESDPDILNTQENVGYQTSALFGREYQVQEIYLTSKDYFSTENKTAIKLILGAPLDMTDYSLQKITFERNGSHSLYNQIKLLGLDTDANEKTFFPLKANLMPFLANVKKLGKEIELNNLWKKGLNWGDIQILLKNINETTYNDLTIDNNFLGDFRSYLELTSGSTPGTNSFKGHILSAPLVFRENNKSRSQFNSSGAIYSFAFGEGNNYKKALMIMSDSSHNSSIYLDVIDFVNTVNSDNIFNLTNEMSNIFDLYADNNNVEIRGNGYSTNKISLDGYDKAITSINFVKNVFGNITVYNADKQQQESFDNSYVDKAKICFKTSGTKDGSNGNLDIKNIGMSLIDTINYNNGDTSGNNSLLGSFNEIINITHFAKTSYFPNRATNLSIPTIGENNPESIQKGNLNYSRNISILNKNGRTITLSACGNDGSEANGGEYDITIKTNAPTDSMRLGNMLIRKIIGTKLYANGFSGAGYDSETGLPINFAALVKEKFTNTNYSPIDVITNIEKEYLLRYPDDKNTPQGKRYKALSVALSSLILSDSSIAGGMTEQNQILQPFYVNLPSKKPGGQDNYTKIAKGIDSENFDPSSSDNITYPIHVFGSSQVVSEAKTNTNPIVNNTISAEFIETQNKNGTTISSIPVYGTLKSKWFESIYNTDKTTYPNNTGLFNPIGKFVSRTPTITTDDEEITFSFMPATKELKEADFTEIPRDGSLNENYTNYLGNILLPTLDKNGIAYNYQENLISLSGEDSEITKDYYRDNIISFIDSTLPIDLNLTNSYNGTIDNISNGGLPYELIFNGTFGSETDLSFTFSYSGDNEDNIPADKVIRIPNINIFNDTDDQVCETTLVM